MKVPLHLIDQLDRADILTQVPSNVCVQPMTIKGETRICLFEHPSSSVVFSEIALEENPILKLGYGIKEVCWNKIRSKVFFRILINCEGRRETLLKTSLNPKRCENDRKWIDLEIDLSDYSGKSVSLSFETYTRFGLRTSWCWAGWSDPYIEHKIQQARTYSKRTSQHHVIFITADALRADSLGCYGHPVCKTPHLDALAEDGLLMKHARSQTPSTLGSYASFLSGEFSTSHGIHGEHGVLPQSISVLPEYLKKQGYQTVFAPSEFELYQDGLGMEKRFDYTIPCQAIPSQTGDITTRKITSWLDERSDAPFFLWAQYFDTHPPHSPSEPFRSMYYKKDPRDPAQSYHPEWIKKIHGVETMAEISYTLEMMSRGFIPNAFYERLMDTAKVFKGELEVGPDLSYHLLSMGPSSYLKMSKPDFARWLEKSAAELLSGKPSIQFERWLAEVHKKIGFIESEILSWLDGVVDYHYPLAQYLSSVSYFDHQIGLLCKALKERGIYDDTTVIISSPHGELMGEHGVHFHHHTLTEEILRIPLIIKPSQKAVGEWRGGSQIDGIFDSVDLYPTILEMIGLPLDKQVHGLGRWQALSRTGSIPEHESFALDYNENSLYLTSNEYVFIKCLKDTYLSDGWHWKKGEKGLYKLTTPMSYTENLLTEHPTIAAEMEEKMDEIYGLKTALN